MEWTPDPDHPLTKVCTKCGREKHLMEFYLDYRTGRRRADCKECCRAGNRQRRAENIERYRARNRAWCAAHVEELRESQRHRYAANAEYYRARARERYAANRARRREQGREWAQQHPERVRESARRYRRRHPRRVLARQVSRGLVRLGLVEVGDRCLDCGSPEFELHHPDYNDPFRVVPLCHRCHMARHWAEWRRTGGGR